MKNLRGSAIINRYWAQGAGLLPGREQFEDTSEAFAENEVLAKVPLAFAQKRHTKSSLRRWHAQSCAMSWPEVH